MDSKGFLGNAITTLITLLSSFLLTDVILFMWFLQLIFKIIQSMGVSRSF